MDEQTTETLKDTAEMHANRDEVRAGIPLLASMLIAGLLAALAVRRLLSGGIVEWTAMIGVFIITAHSTGIVYNWAYSRLQPWGEDSE